MRNSRSSGWRGRRSGLLGLAVLGLLCPFLPAQDFRRGVQPFLEKYCYDCHGDDKTKADLNLELFKDAAGFYRDQRLWRQVITQVVAGEMPPPERKTRPTQAEIEALQGQVRGLLKEAVAQAKVDPGKVTVRRLYRTEYNNTVRDLCYVDGNFSVDFPADDTGYGFDNIGDVLTFSPVHLERFIAAGKLVAERAMPTAEAKRQITVWLESKGLGQKTVNFKLRDWLFSRQRYWGEPFPILWRTDAEGNRYHEALPETALPLMPPTLEDYKPTTDGQPPLARAHDWLHLPDGSIRETNTMPQWAGSCWYYLRYLDTKNKQGFVSPEVETYWMKSGGKTPGVDLYVGGTEHAVLHLLYARFWHKVLFDLGQVSTAEPFFKLVNQGLILGEDGQKMSKSRGNVVNPDDVLVEYGADAFRLYEMFMGPLQDTKPWNTQGVEGVYRFLGRVWRLFVDEKAETDYEQASTVVAGGNASSDESTRLLDLIRLSPRICDEAPTPAQLKLLHECIRKVTHDLEHLQFNTAISAMMVFINGAMTWENRPSVVLRSFLQLLAPFSPHLAEELWQRLHQHQGLAVPSLTYAPWPAFDPALLVETDMELPVQVNGKLRDVIRMPVDASAAEIEAAALKAEKALPFLAGKTVKKVIVVPRKMVNVVVV